MRRRGFSTPELLIVIAIVAVLIGLLFPMHYCSKEAAKVTACQSRLKQFGVALNLYKSDHDDQAFSPTRTEGQTYSYPYNWFQPMASYLKTGEILWCPVPPADTSNPNNFYQYRTWRETFPPATGVLSIDHAYDLEAGNILAYCLNHPDQGEPIPTLPPTPWPGTYPFVREDLSVGKAKRSEIELWWPEPTGWSQVPIPGAPVLRFPNEPWPLNR